MTIEEVKLLRKHFKILRDTEIIQHNKAVPSRCISITFINTGTTNFTVMGGKTIIPQDFVDFSQSLLPIDDEALYNVSFQDNANAGNQCTILRVYLVERN